MTMEPPTIEPAVAETDAAVVVFDGVCHLCSGWVRFLLRRDPARQFRFAAMQSSAGRELLARHGLDPDDPVSFLLLDGVHARTDTDAILAVLHRLGGVWRASAVLRLVPGFLRDPIYRLLARHRYSLFGRRQQCWIPAPEHADRFLDGHRDDGEPGADKK